MRWRRVLVLVLGGSLLAQPAAALQPAGSQEEQRPPSHAATGTKVGAVVGAIAGAGSFVFFGLVIEGVCEYDCPDITPLGYVGLGALGAVLGTCAGVLLGGLFGSMVPDEDAAARDTTGADAELARKASIAALAVQPGFATLTRRPGRETAFSFRANLLAQLRPWLAVGPEFTHIDFAGGMNAIGGAIYAGLPRERWYPYLVADLGNYRWTYGRFDSELSLLGAGLGVGLFWSPPGDRFQFGAEGRFHWTPQNIESPEGYEFVNLGANLRVRW